MASGQQASIPFTPAAVHPGEIVAEYLEFHEWTQRDLARRTGLTPKTISEICNGKAPVMPATALALEKVLRRPAHFWLNLQRQYDEAEARNRELQTKADLAQGIHIMRMNAIESGRETQIPKPLLEQLATALHTTADWLRFGTERQSFFSIKKSASSQGEFVPLEAPQDNSVALKPRSVFSRDDCLFYYCPYQGSGCDEKCRRPLDAPPEQVATPPLSRRPR